MLRLIGVLTLVFFIFWLGDTVGIDPVRNFLKGVIEDVSR